MHRVFAFVSLCCVCLPLTLAADVDLYTSANWYLWGSNPFPLATFVVIPAYDANSFGSIDITLPLYTAGEFRWVDAQMIGSPAPSDIAAIQRSADLYASTATSPNGTIGAGMYAGRRTASQFQLFLLYTNSVSPKTVSASGLSPAQQFQQLFEACAPTGPTSVYAGGFPSFRAQPAGSYHGFCVRAKDPTTGVAYAINGGTRVANFPVVPDYGLMNETMKAKFDNAEQQIRAVLISRATTSPTTTAITTTTTTTTPQQPTSAATVPAPTTSLSVTASPTSSPTIGSVVVTAVTTSPPTGGEQSHGNGSTSLFVSWLPLIFAWCGAVFLSQ